MANILRKVVSGPKARHVDKELNVDLDLSYITDRLIIMGWPASSFEALYRNRRKDVRRFLDAKHGDKYRVYNLCPCSENSYDAKEFYGAVSRYPFPDHHPPPLSLIPMFVCDVTAWLAADSENVAVIHCKAGKGRSGTMACCYMLSLPLLPKLNEAGDDNANRQNASSKSSRSTSLSLNGKQTAMLGNLLADHPDVQKAAEHSNNAARLGSAAMKAAGSCESAYSQEALSQRLEAVFQLHTARRLKPVKQRNKSLQQDVNFLTSDPAEHDRVTQESQHTVRRSRSVAAMLRKASQGFRSASNPLAGNSRRASSTANTPTRNVPSSTSSPSRASALGVTPMGRSMTDLSTFQGKSRRAASTGELNNEVWLTPTHSPLPRSAEYRPFQDAAMSTLERYTLAAGSPESKRGKDIYMNDSTSPSSLRPPLPLTDQGSPSATFRSRLLSTSPYPLNSSAVSSNLSFFASDAPSSAISDNEATAHNSNSDDEGDATDHPTEQPMKLAVSIPSQRRFVGYWARMLAGKDARSEPLSSCYEPVRRIRITSIRINRQVAESARKDKKSGTFTPNASSRAESEATSKEDKTAFSIRLCRYKPIMEYKLHHWETSARRRTRAFGFADPSAPAPDLPKEEIEEHGVDFKGPQRRLLEKEAEAKRWKFVEEQNENGAYERKMSQHDNDCGVGCWGINVLAEQDRIRHFDWSEPGCEDSSSSDEMRIEHLATVYQTSQAYIHERGGNRSTLQIDEAERAKTIMQHAFIMDTPFAKIRFDDKLGTPSWLRDALPVRKSDDNQHDQVKSAAGAVANSASSKASSPTGSVIMRPATHDADRPAHSTPPTSVESLAREEDEQDKRAAVVVNADHALQVKILAGRTGTTHGLLPDMASCGYIWFVPSFESPCQTGEPRKGERIRCTFTANEIDFRKARKVAKLMGGEIKAVEIEWEWLDAGSSTDAESVEAFDL